jgi:hypothetical protein
MLFVESKTLGHKIDGPRRIHLLEELQKKNLPPLIRSVRLKCFDQVLLSPERIGEMETAMATWTESEDQEAYVRGDVFCLSDHVFYLILNDDQSGGPVIRAGIIYEARTSEPFRKLDSFCREVREFLLGESQPGEIERNEALPEWEQGTPSVPNGFKRFVAKQDTDSLYTSLRRETMSERIRAASMLEDPNARIFLRHAKEAHVEGYAAKLLTGDTAGYYETSIERLQGAGLIEPEVQVSCRQTGHALFRLPTADALAVVTVSDARCSECGSAVADEKVEEVIVPTRLAASLLENGSWLITRLHYLLREMGIPVNEIALGASGADGYGQMMANICGESFLLLARDGDLTPAFARWAIDLELETEASHLVVVATGRIHNQAELLLRNHARRRVLAGHDFELILADEAAVAGKELQSAFERVSQRVIAEQLCDLDSSIGLSISRIIITKFKLLRKTEGPGLQNLSRASVPTVSYPKPPLTLAARASAHVAEILDIDELIPDQPPDSPEGDSI